MQSERNSGPYAALWRDITGFISDVRFLQAIGQIIFVIIVVVVASQILTDMFIALESRGLLPNLSFFENRAGFGIAETPDWYTPDSSYWQAFQVGLVNTLRIVILGLISATVLGVFFGIFLLSNNWLVRTISRVYVELLRNTPLLLQLFAWYFIVVLSLPVLNDAIQIPQEGIALLPLRLAVYPIVLVFLVRRFRRGHPARAPVLVLALVVIVLLEGLFIAADNQPPVRHEYPLGEQPVTITIEPGVNEQAATIQTQDGGAAPEYTPGEPGALQLATHDAFLQLLRSTAGRWGRGPFPWLYIAVSAALIAAAWFLPALLSRLGRRVREDEEGYTNRQLRNFALAVTVGQVAAGLLFYFAVVPTTALQAEIRPAFYLSNRGFVFPEVMPTGRFLEWMAFVVIGFVLAAILWVYYGRVQEATGRSAPRGRYALLAVLGFAALGWLLLGMEPSPTQVPVEVEGEQVIMPLEEAREDGLLTFEDEVLYSQAPLLIALPERRGLRFGIGTELTPEYVALFLGLTIYTSAFIAEIVRAGIQSVPQGQIEAARALGFTRAQSLRMIILPQALRVIIPPMGNQYLNLTKNSSLAIAVAYADFFSVSTTIMNQSGQSVSGIVVVMAVYLVMSLTISYGMNFVNRRFQLVTR